jgi:hypothetical protein
MTVGEILLSILVALISIFGSIYVATISSRLKQIEDYNKKNYQMNLCLIMMCDNMPIDERIAAGKRYVDSGGNGGGKEFYQELVKEHIVDVKN